MVTRIHITQSPLHKHKKYNKSCSFYTLDDRRSQLTPKCVDDLQVIHGVR